MSDFLKVDEITREQFVAGLYRQWRRDRHGVWWVRAAVDSDGALAALPQFFTGEKFGDSVVKLLLARKLIELWRINRHGVAWFRKLF
jgi:hypothetical protein